MRLNDLEPDIREEVEKLPLIEHDEVLRLIERFYRNLEKSRRCEADLLRRIANGLTDKHGLGHANVERIRDWFRGIIREEIAHDKNHPRRDVRQ
jgi:hypothetical protein